MFHKKKIYQMNMKAANDTLQNVFAACDQPPNTIPFNKLVLRQRAHTAAFDILLLFTSLLLALTLLAPLPFLAYKNTAAYSSVEISSQYVDGNKLYIVLDTGNHTIKYQEAYLRSPGGDIYEIVSYDDKTCTLCFPYLSQECNIYIPYDDGFVLHLLFNPDTLNKKE